MITLITGLPGNGKTLFGLFTIAEKAQKESREVFYSDINLYDVEPVNSWQKCDPQRWFELPHGAIIVMDEAQFVFPTKANGSSLPDHFEKLSVHRHSGYDIYVFTQHPSLIHNFLRRLVGQHFHCVRKFGLQRCTIHEWSGTNPAPELASSQKNAVSRIFKYPKHVYGWYKSAEVHTVKRAIPLKLILAVLGIVLFFIGAYYALDRYQHRYDKASAGAVGPVPAGPGVVAPGGSGGSSAPFDPVLDAKRYVWAQTPRVEGVQSSAPKYDEITKPVRVPVPAMCVQKGRAVDGEVSCRCYSQQATPLEVGFNECVQIARNGFFEEFDRDHGALASVPPASGAPPAPVRDVGSSGPARPAPDQQIAAGPVVTTIPDVERPLTRVRLTGESKLGR